MTELAFQDVSLEGLNGIIDSDTIPDTAPVSQDANKLYCSVCGKEIFRKPGARGRPPTKCDDHKGRAAGGVKAIGTVRQSHQRKAEQATDVLCRVNAMGAGGLMLAQLDKTASAVAEREDAFRAQALSALLLDEKLCDTVLRAGQTSGAGALLIAYAMLLGSVVPMALLEIRAKRETDGK